jgi:hypothetical protein
MSWLLTDEEFGAADNALREGEVTPALFTFLRRLVAGIAQGSALAAALSPSGRWDGEAVDEVLQGWLAERLLPGGLARAFQVVRSPRLLSRYLETSLRNWLVSKIRSRGGPRLLVRTRRLLADRDEYRRFQEGPSPLDDWWGLGSWEQPSPYVGGDRDLVAAAFGVGDLEPLRYTRGTRLSDPVLSSTDLVRFITGVFERVEQMLTLRHFDITLRGRFAYSYQLPDVPLASWEEPQADELESAPSDLEASAREILAELTGRQVEMLQARAVERTTLDELARRHGVSRGTADNELRRAANIIRRHLLDDANYEAVMERLIDIAFRE